MKTKLLIWILKVCGRMLFNSIDKNKDGKIDPKEIQLILNYLNNTIDKIKNNKKKSRK